MDNLTLMHVFFREDTSVPWFHETILDNYPDHIPYMKENYTDSGKMTIVNEVSEDGSLLIVSFNLSSEEAKKQFMEDEYLKLMSERRNAYNEQHNISRLS